MVEQPGIETAPTPPPVVEPPPATVETPAVAQAPTNPTPEASEQSAPQPESPSPEAPVNLAEQAQKATLLKQMEDAGYLGDPGQPGYNEYVQKLQNMSVDDLEFAQSLASLAKDRDPSRTPESFIQEFVNPEAYAQLKQAWLGTGAEPGKLGEILGFQKPELAQDPQALETAKQAVLQKPVTEALAELTGKTDGAADAQSLVETAAEMLDEQMGGAENADEGEGESDTGTPAETATPEAKKIGRLRRLATALVEFGALAAADLSRFAVHTLVDTLASIDMGAFLEFLFSLQQDRAMAAGFQRREWERQGETVITMTDFKDKIKTKNGFETIFKKALADVNQDTIPNSGGKLGWGDKEKLRWASFDKQGADKPQELRKLLGALYEHVVKDEKAPKNWAKLEKRLLYYMFEGLQNNPEALAKTHLDPSMVVDQSGGFFFDLTHEQDHKLFDEVFGHLQPTAQAGAEARPAAQPTPPAAAPESAPSPDAPPPEPVGQPV